MPFFEALASHARAQEIEILVAAGEPHGEQALRGDAGLLGPQINLAQRELKVLGRRVVVRDVSTAIANADLVIMEQARRNLDAYRLLARAPHRRQLVALWGHGKDYTRQSRQLDRSLQLWLTRRADWFFAYTNGGANAAAAAGSPRERLTVVQNSIDTNSLRRGVDNVADAEVQSFAAAQGLRGKTALFMGALDESKRLGFLFEAVAQAHGRDPDIRLLVGGEGSLHDQVLAAAADLKWLSYLGPLHGHEKAVAFKASQILAMPGRVGLVAVDSFAAETPIVTTDWQWHAPEFEYLENGRNGVITEDSVEAFATGLLETLSDETILGHLREECAADSAIYTIETMVDNFLGGIIGALEAGRK